MVRLSQGHTCHLNSVMNPPVAASTMLVYGDQVMATTDD
jgi:hypothetical protein